jgi:hypothetical protein
MPRPIPAFQMDAEDEWDYTDSVPRDTKNFRNHPRRHSRYLRERPHRYVPPVDRNTGAVLSVDVKLFGRKGDKSPEPNISGSWQWPTRLGYGGSQTEPHHMLCISAARRWLDTSKQHRLDLTCLSSLPKNSREADRPIKWL